MFPKLDVADRDELLQVLGTAVTNLGLARPDYAAALLEREREFATGLPINGGVAIPHTAAEYVLGNTVAAATLAHPVTFQEMASEDDAEIEVSTVLMLVFADASQHVPLLSKIIAAIQDPQFVQALSEAADPSAMKRIITDALPVDQPPT
ncbi:MAG: PTS sugar transporter subunit IIA [Propionicimonas sp.]